MGDIGMIKGGACLGAQTRRRVVVDVVDHRGGISLGVYRREEGEETVNIKQTKHHKASQSITWQYAVLGVT